eukprot:scaffold68947_cov21-Tisochrysis_lutea.AAC.1
MSILLASVSVEHAPKYDNNKGPIACFANPQQMCTNAKCSAGTVPQVLSRGACAFQSPGP